jgi:hypothetical protein
MWAQLVSAHIKAGGKFPRKGTSDYDEIKKKLDAHKLGKQTPKDREDEKLGAEVRGLKDAEVKPKARGRPRKATGVPMPVTDTPIAPDMAALPAPKPKPRTRKVAASKPSVTKDDEIMEAPAEVVLQAKQKMNRQAKTSTMVAADNLPKVKKSVRAPDLVRDLSEKKGMAATIPLARISGTTGIRIPFTDRLMPTVNPVTPGF